MPCSIKTTQKKKNNIKGLNRDVSEKGESFFFLISYLEAGGAAAAELFFSLTGTAGLMSLTSVADPGEKTHLVDPLMASENTLLAPDTGHELLRGKNRWSTRSGDSEPGKPSLNSVALKFRTSSFLLLLLSLVLVLVLLSDICDASMDKPM